MSSVTPRFLVVSEDKSEGTREAVKTLSRRLLQLVVRHGSHLVGWPRLERTHQKVVNGNRWRSTKAADQGKIRELFRRIARHVASDRSSFVLFHVDADVPWARSASSTTLRQWREMRCRLLAYLQGAAEPAESVIDRVLLLAPHYSIEAWLYQNTHSAIRLCRTKYGGADTTKFEGWAKDRAALDEVDRPKEQTCLRDQHNEELAGPRYPTEDVFDAGASLAATAMKMSACHDLCAALSALNAPPAPRD